MTTRFDDDDRYAERDEDTTARRDEYDYERERYERGGYGAPRSYNRYGAGRDYDARDYGRDYQRSADMRDPGYERQNTYGGYARGYGRGLERDDERERDYDRMARRDYGRAYRYARDYGRDYERDERDYYSARPTRDYERGPRGYNYNERRGEWTLRRSGEREPEHTRDARGRERGWWDRVTDEVASWFGDEEAEGRRLRDERLRGGYYRGRGPRGYRRADERIEEEINDRLTDHPYLDATDIEVIVDNGEVTLNGAVDSRQAKRLAEDVAESVSGATNVENRLRVTRGAFDTTTAGTDITPTTTTAPTTATTEPTKETTKTSAANASGTSRSKQ